MRHLKKFNEGIFSKKDDLSDDLKPRGIRSSTGRLDWSQESPKVKSGNIEQRVDPYFIQEISDRLYGPDSEEYIKALKELHKMVDEAGNPLYRARHGKYGSQFYDPETVKDKNIKK